MARKLRFCVDIVYFTVHGQASTRREEQGQGGRTAPAGAGRGMSRPSTPRRQRYERRAARGDHPREAAGLQAGRAGARDGRGLGRRGHSCSRPADPRRSERAGPVTGRRSYPPARAARWQSTTGERKYGGRDGRNEAGRGARHRGGDAAGAAGPLDAGGARAGGGGGDPPGLHPLLPQGDEGAQLDPLGRPPARRDGGAGRPPQRRHRHDHHRLPRRRGLRRRLRRGRAEPAAQPARAPQPPAGLGDGGAEARRGVGAGPAALRAADRGGAGGLPRGGAGAQVADARRPPRPGHAPRRRLLRDGAGARDLLQLRRDAQAHPRRVRPAGAADRGGAAARHAGRRGGRVQDRRQRRDRPPTASSSSWSAST